MKLCVGSLCVITDEGLSLTGAASPHPESDQPPIFTSARQTLAKSSSDICLFSTLLFSLFSSLVHPLSASLYRLILHVFYWSDSRAAVEEEHRLNIGYDVRYWISFFHLQSRLC